MRPRLTDMCNDDGEHYKRELKKRRHIFKQLSAVSCFSSGCDIFFYFHGHFSFSSSKYWILFWSECVSNSWYASFILEKSRSLWSLSLCSLSLSLSLSPLTRLSFTPQSLLSASPFHLSARSPSRFALARFIGMNVGWTVLPKHPPSLFLFSPRLPLKINLIWGHLLFRTLTPYGQPPTQSTSSQFHENLKSSHIKYWWSRILTGCHKLCLEFSLLELWIITSWSFTKDVDLNKTSYF